MGFFTFWRGTRQKFIVTEQATSDELNPLEEHGYSFRHIQLN